MEAIGVLSSCVTALMKLSCCSFRRISRNRKMVLRTNPAVRAAKKITPRKTLIPSRQLRMIQPKPTATATPARPTPRTRNVMVALRLLVMRMARFYREGKENRREVRKEGLSVDLFFLCVPSCPLWLMPLRALTTKDTKVHNGYLRDDLD